MKILPLILVIPLLLLLSACTSSLHSVPYSSSLDNPIGTVQVCITNPELTEELNILQKSGIYQIVPKPTPDSYFLTLKKLTPAGLTCGNSLIPAIFTLGILPGLADTSQELTYTLKKEDYSEEFTHRLGLYRRLSLWEWFFRENEEDVMAEALRYSKRQKSSERPVRWQQNKTLQNTPHAD